MLYKIMSTIERMFLRPFVDLNEDPSLNDMLIIKTLLIRLNKVDFILSWIDQAIIYPKNDLFGIPSSER